MKSIITISLVAGILLLYMSNAGFSDDNVVICGTGDSQTLLRTLAGPFELSHPGTTIEVPESIGSRGGIKATAEGSCTMGRTARHFREDEKKYNLNYKVFALSPIVFAAHPGIKGIDNLTTQQIVDIYSGKITSWDEVGGEKTKIYVADREKGDSSRLIIEEKLIGFKGIKAFAGQIIYTTPDTVDTISHYRHTIGYVPLSMAKAAGLSVMKIDGVPPSIDNVQSGAYKYVVPFLIVWKGDLHGSAKDFVEYLFSEEARNIIANHGAAPALQQN